MKMYGSFLLARADTKEEVIAELKGDIYSRAGVWDWSKVEVIPVSSLSLPQLLVFSI